MTADGRSSCDTKDTADRCTAAAGAEADMMALRGREGREVRAMGSVCSGPADEVGSASGVHCTRAIVSKRSRNKQKKSQKKQKRKSE